jgi:hypothetical protein
MDFLILISISWYWFWSLLDLARQSFKMSHLIYIVEYLYKKSRAEKNRDRKCGWTVPFSLLSRNSSSLSDILPVMSPLHQMRWVWINFKEKMRTNLFFSHYWGWWECFMSELPALQAIYSTSLIRYCQISSKNHVQALAKTALGYKDFDPIVWSALVPYMGKSV